MHYFDVASTAKLNDVDKEIFRTMFVSACKYWHNPSSLYQSGFKVKEKINECRKNIAKYINAKPEEIIFTSGASESNNMAIRGWSDNYIDTYETPHIISTKLEHKSIKDIFDKNILKSEVHYCENDEYGLVMLDNLEHLLQSYSRYPVLVSICLANNEIGTVQHIKMISNLVHSYGAILHVDATQAFCHIPIDVIGHGIDLMSVSGHKVSPALRGIGFLFKKNGVNIQPLICGSQENGLRGGTENTYGIIGLDKAIEYNKIDLKKIDETHCKRFYFENELESKFECKLNGHDYYRLPNNINVTFPQNVTGESLLYMLDISGYKISVGSACNSKSIEPSHVLKAIGLSDEEAMRTIRVTFPDDITYKEIDEFIDELNKCIKLIESQN